MYNLSFHFLESVTVLQQSRTNSHEPRSKFLLYFRGLKWSAPLILCGPLLSIAYGFFAVHGARVQRVFLDGKGEATDVGQSGEAGVQRVAA